MAIYKEDIADINLETGNIHRSFLRHSIGTQDQHADHFGIRVMRDGEPVDLTGISVQGVFMPPQGSPIAITGDTYTIVEGNVAKVILPQACYNYEGSFTLAIKLIDITDSITGTIRIIDGVVDNTHASGTVAPTGSVPTYQEILSVYDDLVDALADVASYASNFAPEFVQGTANAAGSFVMNDGVLYLLPDGHTAGTTWANTTKTQANVGGQLSDLKSAITFQSNGAPLLMKDKTSDNVGPDYYQLDTTVEWEQGSFDSTGEKEDDKTIRSNEMDGGYLIHNTKSGNQYIVARTLAGTDTTQSYPWMDSFTNAEYYYIPSVSDTYKTKIRQRIGDGTGTIVPSQNALEIFRAEKIVPSLDNFQQNRKMDIVLINDKLYKPAGIAFEQGNFSTSSDGAFSSSIIRTGTFQGGIYIYNPGQKMGFCVMVNDGAGNKSYLSFSNSLGSSFYKDEFVYLPKLAVGTYRIKTRKIKATTPSVVYYEITPDDSSLLLLKSVETEMFMSGKCTSSGYGYDNTKAVTVELSLGKHKGIKFKSLNSNYRFAVYKHTGSTYSAITNGWRSSEEFNAYDPSATYVCMIGAVSGVSFNYNDAIAAVEVSFADKVYSYNRRYTDITYSLQWEHGNITSEGIVSDNHYIYAELPCVGNVEVKLNRPYCKFTVWKKDKNGVFSNLVDDNNVWTTYYCRYVSDDDDLTAYYVVVTSITETTTFTRFSYGKKGIKAYTYEDEGIKAYNPTLLYGKTIAVMGDSVVQGRVRKGNADGTNTVLSKPWAYMIAEANNVEPADFGIGGATVYGDEWYTLYTNRDKISGFDVVFVCAGGNDFGADVTEDNFKDAYQAVLTELLENNTSVIAVTPKTRATNSKNNLDLYLSDYVQFIIDVASNLNVPVINLYESTRADPVFIADMPDGIHPLDAGHRMIADFIMNNMPDIE